MDQQYINKTALMDQTEFLNRQYFINDLNDQSYYNQTYQTFTQETQPENFHSINFKKVQQQQQQQQCPNDKLSSQRDIMKSKLTEYYTPYSMELNDQSPYQQLDDQIQHSKPQKHFSQSKLKKLPNKKSKKIQSNNTNTHYSNTQFESEDCLSIHTASTEQVETQTINSQELPIQASQLTETTEVKSYNNGNSNYISQQQFVKQKQDNYQQQQQQYAYQQRSNYPQYQNQYNFPQMGAEQFQFNINDQQVPDSAFSETRDNYIIEANQKFESNQKQNHQSSQNQTTIKKSGCGTSICSSQQSTQKKKSTDETKFKTEMCKNYEELGRCNYGKKCKFAHGKHELMEKNAQEPMNKRTKECQSYHNNNVCPYGIRCMFKHDERDLIQIKQSFFYQKMLYKPELVCNITEYKQFHRLPIFTQIQKQFQSEQEMPAKIEQPSQINQPQQFSNSQICKQLDFSQVQSDKGLLSQQEIQQNTQFMDLLSLNNIDHMQQNHFNQQLVIQQQQSLQQSDSKNHYQQLNQQHLQYQQIPDQNINFIKKQYQRNLISQFDEHCSHQEQIQEQQQSLQQQLFYQQQSFSQQNF